MTQVPFYDLGQHERTLREELHGALDAVLDSGYFIGGDMVTRFEREFAAFIGTADCVAVGNGLDAIRLILEAYGIGPGDEVVVPAFTYYATWLAVLQTGATPIPADVLRETANLDPAAAEAVITERTKAILVVHLYGRGADLAALRAIADRHGIVLIEDAAQSHGAQSSGGRTGSVGDATAFSFYPTKNLGALGDAGGVTTNEAEVAARIRSRRSYGQGASKYDHVDTGWNSRLDPLQAAFLSLHLTHLDAWNARRAEIASRYLAALGDRTGAALGAQHSVGAVWHHFVLLASDRDALRAHLAENGVSTDVHYPYSIRELAPLRAVLTPASLATEFPAAERLGRSVVSLPMGPWMTDAQVEAVASALAALPVELLDV
jgi:dTDP-4-amino-4,6-dideoxygalactose transaminase